MTLTLVHIPHHLSEAMLLDPSLYGRLQESIVIHITDIEPPGAPHRSRNGSSTAALKTHSNTNRSAQRKKSLALEHYRPSKTNDVNPLLRGLVTPRDYHLGDESAGWARTIQFFRFMVVYDTYAGTERAMDRVLRLCKKESVYFVETSEFTLKWMYSSAYDSSERTGCSGTVAQNWNGR